MEENDAYRIMNLFEAMIVEDHVMDKSAPEDVREKSKAFIRSIRQHGIMGENSSGRTNDVRRGRPPKYIEPTEAGYPGLDPPVG